MIKSIKKLLPYFLIAITSCLIINNMFYGFSWTDEGLYLSNISRIIHGDKLIIDDWTPTQFYIPLLYPLYLIFLKLNGNTDGLVLFFRIATVTFQTLIAFFAYFVLSKKYNKAASFFASSLIVIFSRACLNGPSYYTIGFSTYTLGLLCLFSFFELSYSKIFLFISGISFAGSILCNPFLVVPYILISITCLVFKTIRKQLKNIALIWAGTILLGIIYLIFICGKNSISDIFSGLSYTYNDPSYEHNIILTIKRLYKMPRLLIFPYVLEWLPMIFAYSIIKIKKIALTARKIRILHRLNVFCFFAIFFTYFDCGSAVMAFFHFTIFTALLNQDFKLKTFLNENKKELLYFVFPGFILAYFFCFASDTGFGVCSIGMAVAAIGEIFIFLKTIDEINLHIETKIRKIEKFLPVFLLFLSTMLYRVNLTYRDILLYPRSVFIPLLNNTVEKITSGPAKGLYTGIGRKNYYDNLLSLLEKINNENNETGIFISGVATWAYTAFPNVKCAVPTTWRLFCDDERLKLYYEESQNHEFPDYVLLLDESNPDNGGRYSSKNKEENVRDTWIMRQLVEKNYEKSSTPCGVLYKSPKIK